MINKSASPESPCKATKLASNAANSVSKAAIDVSLSETVVSNKF